MATRSVVVLTAKPTKSGNPLFSFVFLQKKTKNIPRRSTSQTKLTSFRQYFATDTDYSIPREVEFTQSLLHLFYRHNYDKVCTATTCTIAINSTELFAFNIYYAYLFGKYTANYYFCTHK